MESLGLLILRLTFGIIFLFHGLHQYMGWFGGGTMASVMQRLGFRVPRLWASLCGLGNLTGGLLLSLGAVTFLGCALIVTVMVVAMITIKRDKGFWERDGGYEYNIAVIGTCVAIGIMGPGPYSLDATVLPAMNQPAFFFISVSVCVGIAAMGLYGRQSPVADD